jgi:tripartite-type tricarboxylate transporter receptor subunit TctC
MTSLTRRAVTAGLLTLPAAAVLAQQPWPAPQLTLVVPFPPGGSTDALARLAQAGLQQRLGATVIVENKAGASGAIGTAQVARAKPDGSSFLVTFDSHAVNPALQPLTFDTEKDLEPVMLVATAPYLIAAHHSRPFKSFADVIAAAKAKPGGVTYASVGTGTIGHLAMVLIGKRAGIDLAHVPYRGGGPAMNDAVAGHVDLIVGSVALITPQLGTGALRPIMQTGRERQPALKDTLTAIESGFEDIEALAWWGVFAPKGTPKDLVERLRAALAQTLREEKAQKLLAETQQMRLMLAGPDVLGKFLSEQIRTWGAVVRENAIKAGN